MFNVEEKKTTLKARELYFCFYWLFFNDSMIVHLMCLLDYQQ